MRVAIDARLYGLQHRGLGRYLVELINALAIIDQTTEFVLILDPRNRERPINLPPNFTTCELAVRVYTVGEQVLLPRLVRSLKVDVTHYPHFSIPFFAPKPFVATVHDLILHRFPSERATTLPSPLYKLKLVGYHLVVRRALRRAAQVLTISQAVARDITHFYPWAAGKLSVVPLAPGTPAQPATVQAPKQYVLVVGAAYPHKNLERAAAAVALARAELPNLTLVVVGRRDVFMKRLEQYVREQGLEDVVQWWGEATEPELAALYRGAAAYFLPSLAEGFGLGALEAIQQGCPVVAADIPVLREVLGAAAEFADPLSIPRLAEAVLRSVRGVAPGINSATKAVLDRYSWQQAAEQTLACYRSVFVTS